MIWRNERRRGCIGETERFRDHHHQHQHHFHHLHTSRISIAPPLAGAGGLDSHSTPAPAFFVEIKHHA